LRQSQVLLSRLVVALKRAHTKTSGEIEKIKEVEQNLFAFKLNIQRARELFSREYPAVVVGDAAVTPHPDTGSGYSSGFRGFKEVKVLLKALANTSNDAAAFLDFGTRYELAVAEKALSGTQNICQNNIGMLTNYKERMEELSRQVQGRSTTNAFTHDIKMAGMLIKILESHDRTARTYEAMVKDKTGDIPTPPMWDLGPKQLWQRMARTWKLIQKLTDQKHLLEPQLAALEAAIKKHS
jgi:hypothetical protein